MKQKRHEITLKHSLGQNFILDESIQSELADFSSVGRKDHVLEIGAGSGMLTKQLAARAGEIVAVELDQEMIPWLRAATLSYPNVRIVQGNILNLSLDELTKGWEQYHIVANLPYHITSQLMTRLLDRKYPIQSIHLMLQKETAEKLCASPGEEGYGSLALKAQWFYQISIRKIYPAAVFTPPPKVDSAFISMLRRATPPVQGIDEKKLFRMITGIFAQKRKTLVNNLTSSFQMTREDALEAVHAAGLQDHTRAEALTIDQIAELTNKLRDDL